MADELHHILVVDDDRRLRELLRKYLMDNGFLVTTAADAQDARARLAALAFDLVVLDVMMPGETGLELTQDLRRTSEIPILLLTARGELDDRIAGLEAGADDYLSKPFEPRELVLRITSILRRVPRAPETPAELRLGRWLYLIDRDELRAGEEVVRLTAAEASLLKILASSPGTTFSREDLSEKSRLNGNVRTIDVQVTRLRRKIEEDPRQPRYLHTVRGEGYVLRPD
ncbi:MAG TPA: response regulator [Azospirillaceae bacterium]|nr:response regulator [Azospirillaceae bacterium]